MRNLSVLAFVGLLSSSCGAEAPSSRAHGVHAHRQEALSNQVPFSGHLTYRDNDAEVRSVLFAPAPVTSGTSTGQGWILMFSTEEGACSKLSHAPAPQADVEARLWLSEQREGMFSFFDPRPSRDDDDDARGWVQSSGDAQAAMLYSGVLNLHYIGDGPRQLEGDIYVSVFDTQAVGVVGRWTGVFSASYCPQLEGVAAPAEQEGMP